MRPAVPIILLVLLGTGCAAAHRASPCGPVDPVLAASSFVLVTEPAPGSRSASPLRVTGCSRTFEANIVWRLHARDGRVLAAGNTTGGGASGADRFAFSASFAVAEPQLGHLEVFAPEISAGEGFPAARTVLPLVLLPRPGE